MTETTLRERKKQQVRQRILARLLPRASNGDVIALHDGRDPGSDAPRNAARDAIAPLLRGLRERGLEPVRLDELVGVDAWAPAEPAPARVEIMNLDVEPQA